MFENGPFLPRHITEPLVKYSSDQRRHPPDPVDTSKSIPLLLAGWSHQRKRDSTQRVPKPEMLNQATSIINLFDINQVFFI